MILEDLGWTIHRIWSPDWVSNREGEIAEIERRVEELLDTGELADERTATVGVDETEPEVADESATADGGVGTFQEYAEPEPRTKRSRDFDDLSNSRVRSDLVDIVEKHGPIEKDVAYTLLVRQYDISRVGKKIRRSLDGMLPHLDGRKLVRRDGFLWPSSVDEIPVRVNGESGDRSADEVPPEEFAKAAYVILENGLEMTRDDLVLETAKKFGWARRGSTIRSRIEEAIDYLVAINAVEETDVVSANGVDIDQYIQNDIYG